MVDVLITNAPVTLSTHPPAAPAVLIAMLKKFGYTASFYDFNIQVKNDIVIKDLAVKKHVSDYEHVDMVFKTHVANMLKYNPKYIGISLFTYQCVNCAILLCLYIRMLAPNVNIILGGQGLGQGGINGISLGPYYKSLNLCNYWVKSEGEHPIIDIMKNQHKNSVEWTQIKDLDEFPYPDYGDYDFNLYDNFLPVTGSRGCVRRCTFCDIHTHWKKYVWRSGQKIAQEMIHQNKLYNKSDFIFTDSLINGSMRAYLDFVNAMAAHNNNSSEPITWSGQFIIRPAKQMPEHVWKLTSESGCSQIAVGVESLSESVRYHMRKKFSNDDIKFSLECMRRYNLKCTFLMIVGYVTDNEQTIKENLDTFTELAEYANNTIEGVCLGTTLGILQGTPLEELAAADGVILGKNENDWTGPSTLSKRTEWRKRLAEHCKSLGYKLSKNEEQMSLINMFENVDV